MKNINFALNKILNTPFFQKKAGFFYSKNPPLSYVDVRHSEECAVMHAGKLLLSISVTLAL